MAPHRTLDVRLRRPGHDGITEIGGAWESLPRTRVSMPDDSTLESVARKALSDLPISGGYAALSGAESLPTRISFKTSSWDDFDRTCLIVPTDSGKLLWNVYWPDVTVGQLWAGWERGSIPGEIGSICLVDMPGIGNGFTPSWQMLLDALPHVTGALGYYFLTKQTAQEIRTFARRVGDRLDALSRLQDAVVELDSIGGTPELLASFYAIGQTPVSQAASDLGVSESEATDLLALVGFRTTTDGLLEVAYDGIENATGNLFRYVGPLAVNSPESLKYATAAAIYGALAATSFPVGGSADHGSSGPYYKCQCPESTCTNLIHVSNYHGLLKGRFTETVDHFVISPEAVQKALHGIHPPLT